MPAGWLERFAWKISRAEVEALSARVRDKTAFLCGSVENEVDVRDLFDLMVCLVADNETLRDRLETRTTNAFGKLPEELAAALGWNDSVESTYRHLGATIIDGRRPPPEVPDRDPRCRCEDRPKTTSRDDQKDLSEPDMRQVPAGAA